MPSRSSKPTDLFAVRIEPGDSLVITLPPNTSTTDREAMRTEFNRLFPSNEVVFLVEGVQMVVTSPAR